MKDVRKNHLLNSSIICRVLSALLFLVCAYNVLLERAYFNLEDGTGYLHNLTWWICVSVMVLALILAIFYDKIPVWHTRLLPVFIFADALASFCLMEFIIGNNVLELDSSLVFYNFILCSLLFIALSLLFLWNGKLLLFTGTFLCVILGLIEYYVLEFRGTPLVLNDLLSAGTAMDVLGSYTLDITRSMKVTALILILLLLWQTKIRFQRYRAKAYAGVLVCLLLLGSGGFLYLQSLPLLESAEAATNGGIFWNLQKTYKNNGFFLGTYMYQSFQRIDKPEDYSKELVAEKADQITEEYPESLKAAPESSYPNIIAIMNESWTVFDSAGGIETTEPVTPFIDSLTENTVRGSLLVSVYAGGTANTEFEFLTGSTMNFLPGGSSPYEAYVKREIPSFVSYMDRLGYLTYALHVANAKNYNRENVYPMLGFDEFASSKDLKPITKLRTRASDSFDYQKLIERYESFKESGDTDHFFCFNVTIQNHGGYTDEFTSEIGNPLLLNAETDHDTAVFLALLRESDEAFKELIEYFEKEEEPTVILMFGDHWPKLTDSLEEYLKGRMGETSDLEWTQARSTTPFLIWANYDIEEREIGRISPNYLFPVLLETAGVPLNPYQEFLADLMEEVPAMNRYGYIDADGNYLTSVDELNPAAIEKIRTYQLLQYGDLFGKLQGLDDFYG